MQAPAFFHKRYANTSSTGSGSRSECLLRSALLKDQSQAQTKLGHQRRHSQSSFMSEPSSPTPSHRTQTRTHPSSPVHTKSAPLTYTAHTPLPLHLNVHIPHMPVIPVARVPALDHIQLVPPGLNLVIIALNHTPGSPFLNQDYH